MHPVVTLGLCLAKLAKKAIHPVGIVVRLLRFTPQLLSFAPLVLPPFTRPLCTVVPHDTLPSGSLSGEVERAFMVLHK